MSIKTELRLFGHEATIKALREVPIAMERAVIRKALRKGAQVIRKAVASAAPKKSGLTRKAIRAWTKKRTGRHSVHVQVGVSLKVKSFHSKNNYRDRLGRFRVIKFYDTAFYARFIELGTKKWRGKPFMLTAFIGSYRGAIDAINRYMRTGLQREVDLIARRAKRKSLKRAA